MRIDEPADHPGRCRTIDVDTPAGHPLHDCTPADPEVGSEWAPIEWGVTDRIDNAKRNAYSDEFKEAAVREVIDRSRHIADVARENGLVAQTLGNWVNVWRAEHVDEQPPLSLTERARLKELERQLRELRMENEFLGKATCYNNAWAESVNGTLKNERVNRTTYPTREHARIDISRYIELRYNQKRLHSVLGYITPNEVERTWFEQKPAI